MIQRGSVVEVMLSPTVGHEQAGRRPAVVVSATNLNERASILVVAPVTTKKTDRVFPFEAMLDYEACGLSAPSKVMLNQIRTVDKERILKSFGLVDRKTMGDIDAALKVTLDL